MQKRTFRNLSSETYIHGLQNQLEQIKHVVDAAEYQT